QRVWDDAPPKKPARRVATPTPSEAPKPAKAIARASESTMVGRMLRIAIRKQSGRLNLSNSEGSASISYKDGKVVAVETDLYGLDIAAYLTRNKILDDAAVEEGVAHAPNMGGDIGGALIALGKIQPH
ncbi:unnamed protein product, partial [Laminaria digitata]